MALFSSFGEVNLDALDATITDNAVDIFVYDTRKDSDGGKWRKRTKKTSWYNETLNTATRGSRRDFPAVAVIVAEIEKLTIYDGDDPDLPMWMVFISPSTLPYSLIPNVAGDIKTITALNGKISLGYHHNYGLGVWDFISEFCIVVWRENSRSQYAGNIAERNDQKGTISLGSPYILDYRGNDVAMTVLPNAPIDSATQLPIPTIAVATNGGVSVIKDDGSVVNSSATNAVRTVTFDKNNTLITTLRDYDNVRIRTSYLYNGFTSPKEYWYGNTAIPSSPLTLAHNGIYRGINAENTYGNILGLTKYTYNEEIDRLCYITSSYNTGWMHGDIKGAFLSDTDTTNAGSELITNGTFDTDTTGWTAYNSVISVDSNRLKIDDTADAGGWSSAVQEISTEIGKTYYLTFTYTYSADSLLVGHYAGSYASAGAGTAPTSVTDYGTTSGTYTRMIAATTTTTSIIFTVNNQGVSFVDNITFKEAVQDRSVNNKGLQVFGTITKTPVATGADLVAYSGNGTSNYFERPYDTDLNFGTGDFSIMGWIYTQYVGGGQYIFNRSTNTTLREFELWVAADLGYISMWLNSAVLYSPNGVIPNLTWTHFCAFRKSGYAEIYINGRSVVGGTSTMTVDTTNPAKILYNCSPTTKLSLLRVSGTVPSPEQIKKIYEDEKVLFQENAKCTLYGSSDAVTALAYDDKTNLLHVGTSSGRSDFKGLRRINNTTTGITTTISASNGLIAEQ